MRKLPPPEPVLSAVELGQVNPTVSWLFKT